MLRDLEYARQLDNVLDSIGNDQSAMDRLNAALEQMPERDDTAFDQPEFDPGPEDYSELEEYLDWLDAIREYPPEESPLWKAWLNRVPVID